MLVHNPILGKMMQVSMFPESSIKSSSRTPMKKKSLHKLQKQTMEYKEQQEETKIRIAMFHVKNEMFIHKEHLPIFEQQVSA